MNTMFKSAVMLGHLVGLIFGSRFETPAQGAYREHPGGNLVF